MTWRDGVHLTGTPIWCDARRRRDVCFVSSAERVGRTGHGQLIATPLTLALLGAPAGGHLGVPLHRRFTLGTVRLELVASGRGPGAAALHVDIAGRSVLYAGAIRAASTASIEAAEVRSCNAAVVTAPYGEERHRFPPLADVVTQTIEWTRSQLALDRWPVVLVDTVLDALEVATCLHAAAIPVTGARAIRDAARRAGTMLGELAIAAPGRESLAGKQAPARQAPFRQAIVWLDADRAGLARALGDRARATALVSARALDGTHGADAGFVWASAAGRADLLAWIESTGAREVFVTGACAGAIAATLGPRARMLGPPHQMTLFPREAVS